MLAVSNPLRLESGSGGGGSSGSTPILNATASGVLKAGVPADMTVDMERVRASAF
jgi:hypothetical protein